MDKLKTEDLQYVRLPLNSFVKQVICPECGTGTLQQNPDGKKEFSEDINESYSPYKCGQCAYEAMLPMTHGSIEYENANLDATRDYLRDEFGHSGVIAMIWARTHNYGIGHKGDLPWGREFPSDLAWFKKVTTHQPEAVLVTGRATYESMPELQDRTFAVLTTSVSEMTPLPAGNGYYYPDIPTLLSHLADSDLIVCGGSEVYKQWMGLADIVFETVIIANYPVDKFCPMISPIKYDSVDSFLVRNCDDTGKDAIFNYWMARKVKGTMEEHLINERWNFRIQDKFDVDTSNA